MSDSSKLNISGMSDVDALREIGILIDLVHTTRSQDDNDRAFVLLDELQRRTLAPDVAALAYYFRANAWAGREVARPGRHAWSWEQPELQEQILELRRAVTHEGFGKLPKVRRCQILTNLANQLDRVGRFIEAIEIWDRALALNEKFAMARGNRGIALDHYAHALYDSGHVSLMLEAAHDALASATSANAFYESAGSDSARAIFRQRLQKISTSVAAGSAKRKSAIHQHSLGKNDSEKRYRTWCLEHRLFINPLNDLGPLSIAAQDVLTLPSLTAPISSDMPPIIGFFNQMKQEFVSARYLYYEGLTAHGPHFSDYKVLLYNTLDYPAYSLATEKVRMAFRMAYSLFDKISVFLNHYLSLGLHTRQVSFRGVWYQAKGSPPALLSEFVNRQNWPLRGLFWLSKDLFEENFRDVSEPDAAALNDIRNYLEHKYLQLHEASGAVAAPSFKRDLSVGEFRAKTLRLLKLSRAALTYLALSVHREELEHKKARAGKFTPSIRLDSWEDEWKQ